jgi:hypothetical protein
MKEKIASAGNQLNVEQYLPLSRGTRINIVPDYDATKITYTNNKQEGKSHVR